MRFSASHIFVIFIFAIAQPFSVVAQGTAPQAVTVATVNIYDAAAVQAGHTFSVGFALSNREGVQPDILYAVLLLKKGADGESAAVDVMVYEDDVLDLRAGETVLKTAAYTAPASSAGAYRLAVEARSSAGLLFSHVEIPTDFTLTKTDDPVGIADGTKDSSLQSLFLTPAPSTGAAVQNLTLDKDAYARGDTANISLFWNGTTLAESAFAALLPGSEPVVINRTITAASSTASILVALADGRGAPCADPYTYLAAPGERAGLIQATLPVTAACANPVITADIFNAAGEPLASRTFTVTSASAGAAGANAGMMLFALALLPLLAATYLGARFLRKKNVVTALLFIFVAVGGVLIGGQEAKADMYYYDWRACTSLLTPSPEVAYYDENGPVYLTDEYGNTMYYSTWCLTGPGPQYDPATQTHTELPYLSPFSVTYTISLDKTSYTPGETITAYGYTGIVSPGTEGGHVRVGIGATVNGSTKNICAAEAISVCGTSTNTFTAPSTPGTYNAVFDAYVGYYQVPNQNMRSIDSTSQASIPYTVVASPPTASLTPAQQTVSYGDSATLTVSSTGADACNLTYWDNDDVYRLLSSTKNGDVSTGSITKFGSRQFNLYCWNSGGNTGWKYAYVNVPPLSCTGSVPANASAYAAPDDTGLAADTAYSYSATDTATKCQFTCAANYTWDGTSCVADTQTNTCPAKPATGTVYNTVSSYAQTWNGSAWTPASDATTEYNTTASATSCRYTCAAGYKWNGSACVVLPDITAGGITPTSATKGVVTTFSATVSNTGAPTGAGFTNFFQKATNALGANATSIGTASVAALPAPGAATASINYTPASAGNLYIRICADKSGLGNAGVITESKENNNCGGWTKIVVANPTIAATCSVTPTSGLVGDTFTWTVSDVSGGSGSYEYLWGGTDSLSGINVTSVQKSYATAGTKTASVTVTSGGDSRAFACGSGVTVTALPDLTAGAVSPVTATKDAATTFNATISNIGLANTGDSFHSFMQVATAPDDDGTITDIVPHINMAAIASGGTGAFSKSHTFASTGTYSLRVCADKNNRNSPGAITESNEGNNCGEWTTITVSNPAIAGSCSVSPSSGFIGESFTWSTSGVSGGDGTYTYAWSGTDGLSGSGASVAKAYVTTGTKTGTVTVTSAGDSRAFACTNSVSVTSCYGQGCVTTDPPTSGCPYSGPAQPKINVPAQCCSPTPGVCPALPTATLSANPEVIDQGQSTRLTWSSTNATSCYPSAGEGVGFSTGGQPNNAAGVTVGPLTETVSYGLTCTGQGGSAVDNEEVTVLQPQASISANPPRVSSGGSTTLTWSASGVRSCVVTGPAGTLASGNADSSHNFSTGSGATPVISAQSTFTITCQTNGNPISESVTVNVLARFREF